MYDIISCLVTIKSLYPSMRAIDQKIADFILSRPENVINMNVAQIAAEVGAAESSIVRFSQTLGFSGFKQLKINIAKNLKKPEEIILEDISLSDDLITVANKVFASRIESLQNSFNMINRVEFQSAIQLLLNAKRIEFYGVGMSGFIASSAYYRFMRIGMPAFSVTDPHIARISASMLDEECVAIGISHTGRTKDTINILEIAKRKGAKVISVTSFPKTPLTQVADVNLIVSSSELNFMKEEVSSMVAQIAVLDSLFTCVALKRYDNVQKNMESVSNILKEIKY